MADQTTEEEKVLGEDSRLSDFLRELVEKQDHILITRKDMDQLLDKYPLTPPDKEKLQMLVDRHLVRAGQSRQQERWDTAIVETERALLFSPLDADLRLDLAELYLRRSEQYGFLEKDLLRSEEKIRESLILQPGHRNARKMQKELQQLNRMLNGKDQNRKIIPFFLISLLVIVIALIPRYGYIFRFFSSTDTEESGAAGDLAGMETDWEVRDLDLRIADSLTDTISLDIAESVVTRRSGGYAVSLQGYAETVKGPLSALVLKLSMGDPLSPVLEKDLEILGEGQSPLAPGESLPFFASFHMTEFDPAAGTMSVSLKKKEKWLDDELPPEWSSLEPFWDIPVSEGAYLSFESRPWSMIEGYDRTYLFQEIRVQNRGAESLDALDLTVRWYDGESRELRRRPVEFVSPGLPPVKGGSVQTRRIMVDFPKKLTPLVQGFLCI